MAILKIVKVMQDEGIGYGSINHPIDTCRKCGHRGVIYSKCPVCGSDDILRMRRITGYLTGSLESWNSAKQARSATGKAPVISILTGIFCTSLAGRNSYIRSYAPASPHFTKPENRSAIIEIGGPLSARLKSKFTRRKNPFLPPSPVACGKSPPKV